MSFNAVKMLGNCPR